MSHEAVSPESYSEEYFLSECHGCDEYRTTRGMVLPRRLQAAFELGAISPGMRVIDIGCGRGEIALHSSLAGADAYAVDYSDDALRLTRRILDEHGGEVRDRVFLQRADAQHLPFAEETFDRAFMLDLVEHLHPAELSLVLREVHRVLRSGGCLVVHTMPNLWYLRYGYPLYRLVQRARGQALPADPRQRWRYGEVHVNEQDVRRLKGSLRNAGFRSKVWLRPTETFDREESGIVRAVMRALVTVYPFRWLFCNDIFGIASRV